MDTIIKVWVNKVNFSHLYLVKSNLPKMDKSPQAAHNIRANKTLPDRSNTPPGLMKIPDPWPRLLKSVLFDIYCNGCKYKNYLSYSRRWAPLHWRDQRGVSVPVPWFHRLLLLLLLFYLLDKYRNILSLKKSNKWYCSSRTITVVFLLIRRIESRIVHCMYTRWDESDSQQSGLKKILNTCCLKHLPRGSCFNRTESSSINHARS